MDIKFNMHTVYIHEIPIYLFSLYGTEIIPYVVYRWYFLTSVMVHMQYFAVLL